MTVPQPVTWPNLRINARVACTDDREVATIQGRDLVLAVPLGYCHHRGIRRAEGKIGVPLHEVRHAPIVCLGQILGLEFAVGERTQEIALGAGSSLRLPTAVPSPGAIPNHAGGVPITDCRLVAARKRVHRRPPR